MEIIENLIDEFHRLGYAVTLDGENIKLKYELHNKPDRSRITPLLNILKEHKADVIGYLKNTQTSQVELSDEPIQTKAGDHKDSPQIQDNTPPLQTRNGNGATLIPKLAANEKNPTVQHAEVRPSHINTKAAITKPGQQFPKTNPEGHTCHVCGAIAERFALSLDRNVRWGWFCLSCKPYAEPERNQNLPAL